NLTAISTSGSSSITRTDAFFRLIFLKLFKTCKMKNWQLPIFSLTNNDLLYHKAKRLVLNCCFFHAYTHYIKSGHLFLHKRTMERAEAILIGCFSTTLETGTLLS